MGWEKRVHNLALDDIKRKLILRESCACPFLKCVLRKGRPSKWPKHDLVRQSASACCGLNVPKKEDEKRIILIKFD
jgi:hypothetical protein